MSSNIRQRVREAANFVLQRDKSIGPIDLLVHLGFLHFSHIAEWRRQNPYFATLQPHIQCGPKKLQQVYTEFLAWANETKLESFSAEYKSAKLSGVEELKITDDGDPNLEAFFRTHFRRSDLTEKQKERIQKKKNKVPDLVVFQCVVSRKKCNDCQIDIDTGDLFFLEFKQPICLDCADLAHLEFLPSGDATLTRRSRKHSPLSAIVTRFNKRRKKHDRIGVLVTGEAIESALAQNKGDESQRARARERAAAKRTAQDQQLVQEVALLILEMFPGCPVHEANQIATHTAERGSGRVGRSEAGRNLAPQAIQLAVQAWIRHQHTDYDSLLMQGMERMQARSRIRDAQQNVIREWQK